MPISRSPAVIALPGRSITQFTVSPVTLTACPTTTEKAENTAWTGPRRSGTAGVGFLAFTVTGESAVGSLALAAATGGGAGT